MALPALLGGLARGAAMGGRGLMGSARGIAGRAGGALRSGVIKSPFRGRGGTRGGALVKTGDNAIVKKESGSAFSSNISGSSIVKSEKGGALVPATSPRSEKSSGGALATSPVGDSALDILRQVQSTADRILEVEVKDLGNQKENLDNTKDQIEDDRKEEEKEKRDEEENKQEESKAKKKRGTNPIASAAKKTVGGIWDFLTGLLGDFIKYKILDWIGDPKNREKIQGIIRFVQKIPEYFGMFMDFIKPWWDVISKIAVGGFEVFKEFLDVFVDIVTGRFIEDPQAFFENLLDIPKKIIEVVPGIIDSLLTAVTGGFINNIGELVNAVFKNPLAGIDIGEKLAGVGNTITSIFKDPLGFLKNIGSLILQAGGNAISGLAEGVMQFGSDIGGKLSEGFGAARDAAGDFFGSALNFVTGATPARGATLDEQRSLMSSGVMPQPAGVTDSNNVSGFRISSRYGSDESFRSKPHGGMDVATPVGTPIAFTEPGEIVAAGRYGGYGNLIDAWLPKSKIQLRLAHLNQIIKKNGTFRAGEVIGKTGGAAGDPGAGSSTGPHLHFEADRTKGGAKYGGSGDPSPYASLLILGGNTGVPKTPEKTQLATNQQQPTSGQLLREVQTENSNLESRSSSSSPVAVNNTTTEQILDQTTTDGAQLGSTMPTSGLWSTFSYNL